MNLPPELPDRLRPRSGPLPVRTDRLPRPTSRVLAGIEHSTIVRVARAQSESLIQSQKIRELHALGREAVTDDVLLAELVKTLSGGDLLVVDRLSLYTSIVRVGTAEILAETVDTFARDSRGGRP